MMGLHTNSYDIYDIHVPIIHVLPCHGTSVQPSDLRSPRQTESAVTFDEIDTLIALRACPKYPHHRVYGVTYFR